MLEKIKDPDLATLESWTRRGVLAASLDEVTDPNGRDLKPVHRDQLQTNRLTIPTTCPR